MNPIHFLTVIGLAGCLAAAAQPTEDPLSEHIYAPDLVLAYQVEIGLTDVQREFIMTEIKRMEESVQRRTEVLQEAVRKLTSLLDQESTDETDAVARLDEVMKHRHQIERAQWTMLVRIKNRLTAGQREQLRELRAKWRSSGTITASALMQELQSKVERVQTRVQQWQSEGRNPEPVIQLMTEFGKLMQQSRHAEAEELLEQALDLMDGGNNK